MTTERKNKKLVDTKTKQESRIDKMPVIGTGLSCAKEEKKEILKDLFFLGGELSRAIKKRRQLDLGKWTTESDIKVLDKKIKNLESQESDLRTRLDDIQQKIATSQEARRDLLSEINSKKSFD